MKRLAPAARRFGNFDAVRAFRGDPDDTADGPVTQVLFRNGRQVAWRAGQLLPAQETAVVGQDRVDTRKIARSRYLGVSEGQPFIAEGGGEHLLGQRQDPQKPHEFGGQEAFAPASSRTWFRSMVADHSEGGGAYMASDGPGFGEGQGTCRRHGVLSGGRRRAARSHRTARREVRRAEDGLRGQAAPGREVRWASGSEVGCAPAVT